jgi:hypothetical protein
MPKRWILARRPLFDDLEARTPEPGTAEPDVEVEVDDDLEVEFATLYADDSEALARWKDQLSEYVDLQGTLDALRLRPSSEQPWPAFDNPMLGYLRERGTEIAAQDGLAAAVAWLAANAWFEGAIAERSRFIRLLDAD